MDSSFCWQSWQVSTCVRMASPWAPNSPPRSWPSSAKSGHGLSGLLTARAPRWCCWGFAAKFEQLALLFEFLQDATTRLVNRGNLHVQTLGHLGSGNTVEGSESECFPRV